MSLEMHEVTADRILEAAGTLFSDLDFELVSIREIAAEAGCHFSAITYHFGSKDQLYQRVLERAALSCDVFPYFEAHRGDFSDPAGQIEEIVTLMLRSYVEKNRDDWQVRLMAREMFKPSPHNGMLRQFWEPGLTHMQGLMQPLRGLDPTSEAAMFHAGMIFMLIDSIGQSLSMIEEYAGHPMNLEWMVGHVMELIVPIPAATRNI